MSERGSVQPQELADEVPRRSFGRRILDALNAHRLIVVVVLAVFVGAGLFTYLQVRPLLSTKYTDVAYTVPTAPTLTAQPGEKVYRIDPSRSSLTYGVDEKLAGQPASRAEGSTSGIAGDLAINATNPSTSRLGEIVTNVEQFHSDDNLRDARIRDDYLESHDHPLATFAADSLDGMPASITDGQSASFKINGQLTVHGVTAPVTWDAQAQLEDGELTATATTQVKMSTFDVGPISLAGLVSTSDDVSRGSRSPPWTPRPRSSRQRSPHRPERGAPVPDPRTRTRSSRSWLRTARRATTAVRSAPSTG